MTISPPSARTWHRLTVRAPGQLADAIGARLLDLGAPGLETREDGDGVVVTAHFADRPRAAALEELFDDLADLFPGTARPTCESAEIADTDWAENWKEHFPPLAVGERLFIHPPWVKDLPADRIPIVIDPGMAFGTGHHASTRGCLVLLQRLAQTDPPARVLDIGTGSGILAIAAVKLGARSVLATDIDPLACAIAGENCAANRVAAHIEVRVGSAPTAATFDLVLANLLAGDLIRLAGDIAALLSPHGIAVGSGLTEDEAGGVCDAWRTAGLHPRDRHSEEGWVTLAFAKKD